MAKRKPQVPRIKQLPIGKLKPYEHNARGHSEEQVAKIANSIQKFGFTNPILVSQDNTIIAGHARLEAAKLLKLKTVPTIELGHLSDAEQRAYVLADNRLAESGFWHMDLLQTEMERLLEDGMELLDLGFTPLEIDFERPWMDGGDLDGLDPNEDGILATLRVRIPQDEVDKARELIDRSLKRSKLTSYEILS